jgi:hypothetical protein
MMPVVIAAVVLTDVDSRLQKSKLEHKIGLGSMLNTKTLCQSELYHSTHRYLLISLPLVLYYDRVLVVACGCSRARSLLLQAHVLNRLLEPSVRRSVSRRMLQTLSLP